MRAGRIAILIGLAALVGVLAMGAFPRFAAVRAQVLGQPLAPPPPPPGAAVTTTPAAMPTLAPLAVPSPAAFATPSARTYQCSCYGPGSITRWMGSVQSQNNFAARQSAVNACLAYNFNRRPGSSFIPPQRFAFFPTPAPPIASAQSEPGLPTLQAPGVSGFALLESPRAILLRLCSVCACN